MLILIHRLIREDNGQGMVEYGLIISFIALAVVGALRLFGEAIPPMFEGAIEGFE